MGFYTGFADGEIFEACTIFVTLVRMAKIFATYTKASRHLAFHFSTVYYYPSGGIFFFELFWHVFVYHFSSGPHGYILES